ncbi:MAG TPA: hypothetical protein PKY94_10265, partial [Smithellaceae bacterium]|nr:hypothetical protein [Smithellaceae bacterium]
ATTARAAGNSPSACLCDGRFCIMRDHVIAKERSDGKSSSLEEVWISPFGRNDKKEVEMTI